MSDEFGPTFVTVTDEEGEEQVLEFVCEVEHKGQIYRGFFPTSENEDEADDGDLELIILKTIEENGEELLSTLDSEEELTEVYEVMMQVIEEDEEEDS